MIASHITQHTLWQALTRDLPPLALPPAPIMSAALDSREIDGGGLFAAFPGQETDGHLFVGNALLNGAQAVICEERGRNRTLEHGAVIVDCRTDAAGGSESPRNWLQAATDSLSDRQIVYIVDSTMLALQALGGENSHGIVDGIFQAVESFASGAPADDDRTVIVVQANPQ